MSMSVKSTSNPRIESRAILLKEKIENGEKEPSHNDIEIVSKRLLRLYGWDYTFKWIEEVYDDNFLPEDTKRQLDRIIREQDLTVEIPTDYNHDRTGNGPQIDGE